MSAKIPVSVLVVIHTPALDILLLERAPRPGFWQSVTGSIEHPDEAFEQAAWREVQEETGIGPARGRLRRWPIVNTFEIFTQWRHRFRPGTTHNTEHMYSLQLPAACPVQLAPEEHRAYQWLPWPEAAEKCFSWSNRDAIRLLPERAAWLA